MMMQVERRFSSVHRPVNASFYLVAANSRLGSILSIVDQVLKLEKELEKAEADQNFSEVEQIEGSLETLVETVERTEHIGELEGKLAELKIITDELAEDGADKERQRVKSLVADQEKLLKLGVCPNNMIFS